MASRSKGLSFKDLAQRDDYLDYELVEEENKKTPKKNPFDFGDTDASLNYSESSFGSQTEVKEFLNASRGIAIRYEDDNNSDSLGTPWGGAQYSIVNEKPKAESARLRSSSSTSSQSSAPKPTGSFDQAKPARPPAAFSSSQKSATPQKSSSNSSAIAKTLSSPRTPTSAPHTISAGAVRNKAGTPVGSTSTTKSSIQAAASSISEVVATAPQVSTNEYYRLLKEVGQLRRDLQAAKQSNLKPLPVAESVKRIIRGQPYSLELHKSLKNKVELLDCALKLHDGNAIIAVILFLKKTVKNTIFLNQLTKRPKAVQHYSKFLQQHYDFDDLAQLYRRLGRYEDAAILKFKQAIKLKDPSIRLTTLQEVLRNNSTYPNISQDCISAIQDYVKLLELQISLEHTDARAELEKRNMVMTVHPRQASLPLLPVVTTLFYCCMYHYGELEDTKSSPHYLRNTFKLTEKQYEWTAIAACAKIRKWKEIDDLLKGKGWFGSSKPRSLIGYGKVVILLCQSKAPDETKNKYLRLMDDQNERVSLAAKCKCHDVVIETLVAMKDRQKLDKYREQMPNHAPQHQTISNYLRNTQIRWKN